jgi:hypothetical protein
MFPEKVREISVELYLKGNIDVLNPIIKDRQEQCNKVCDKFLAQLLALNREVTVRIEKGEPVTAPGIPAGFPKPETLPTEDCIRPSA